MRNNVPYIIIFDGFDALLLHPGYVDKLTGYRSTARTLWRSALTLPPFTAPREAAKTLRTFIRRDHVQFGSALVTILGSAPKYLLSELPWFGERFTLPVPPPKKRPIKEAHSASVLSRLRFTDHPR